MKHYFVFIFIFLIIATFSEKLIANINNSILVKVDKKIITDFDVKNKILSTLIINEKEVNQSNINNLKEQTLNFLIYLRLKEIELENFNFEINKQNVDSYLKMISKNKPQELKDKFKSYGINYNTFIEEIKIELKWQQFIYKRYSNRIEIDEEQINNEVQKILISQKNNYEVNLSEIEIFQNNSKSNNEIISQIENEIKNYSFEDAALKFSISNSSSKKGKLGWLNMNVLSDEIKNLINKMNIGEVSKPIFGSNSILFLKLNSKRNTKINEDDKNKLKNNLIKQKQNEMFNLFSTSHLSKLKNNYFVEYK